MLWPRRIVLLILAVLTVAGPAVVMQDTDPPWGIPWLQPVAAASLAILGFAGILVFSLSCLTGDISEYERRRERDQRRLVREANDLQWQEMKAGARKRANDEPPS